MTTHLLMRMEMNCHCKEGEVIFKTFFARHYNIKANHFRIVEHLQNILHTGAEGNVTPFSSSLAQLCRKGLLHCL